ncbi:MAG: photosystem II S4 domain protein [Firmicutes bacterium]|mgnify:CR=1 FL=1|nr:photosystem II S4 domain protein [Bacillota bacterium]NLO65879.1 photosystem II S4 domain protein [Bacillota bacterium]
MDKERLLSHLRGEDERRIGDHVLGLAKLAWETNKPQVTDFYDPYQQQVARSVLGSIPEVGVLVQGGYKQAERARLVVYPQFYVMSAIQSPLRVLEAKGNFSFHNVGHGDFLGSLLATGLDRDKIGDIIVLPSGCQAIVAAEVADYLLSNWTRVHQVSVDVQEIDEEQLSVEPERIKEIRTTVASLRLDAIAAGGYGTSRSKIAREIKAEKLKLNWKPVTNPALSVTEGDVLSLRGRGRVVVSEIGGKTRKGRTTVVLHRYY